MKEINIETICRAIRELDYQCEILARNLNGSDDILQMFTCNRDALGRVGAVAEQMEKRDQKLAAFEKWLHENPGAAPLFRQVIDKVEDPFS